MNKDKIKIPLRRISTFSVRLRPRQYFLWKRILVENQKQKRHDTLCAFQWVVEWLSKHLYFNAFREFTTISIKFLRIRQWPLQLRRKWKGVEMVLLGCLVGLLWLQLLGDYIIMPLLFEFCISEYSCLCCVCDSEPSFYLLDSYSYCNCPISAGPWMCCSQTQYGFWWLGCRCFQMFPFSSWTILFEALQFVNIILVAFHLNFFVCAMSVVYCDWSILGVSMSFTLGVKGPMKSFSFTLAWSLIELNSVVWSM